MPPLLYVQTFYPCTDCNDLHDGSHGLKHLCEDCDETPCAHSCPLVGEEAERSEQAEYEAVHSCPICQQEHYEFNEALVCWISHEGDPTHCPGCFRPAERPEWRVEIAQAGHCSVCNPHFTLAQSLAISDVLRLVPWGGMEA